MVFRQILNDDLSCASYLRTDDRPQVLRLVGGGISSLPEHGITLDGRSTHERVSSGAVAE